MPLLVHIGSFSTLVQIGLRGFNVCNTRHILDEFRGHDIIAFSLKSNRIYQLLSRGNENFEYGNSLKFSQFHSGNSLECRKNVNCHFLYKLMIILWTLVKMWEVK